MRQIKFRAWHKKYKLFFKVSSIMFDGMEYITSSEDLGALYDGMNSGEYHCEPDAVELMQYTGLKDKNSVEIYEGDIVKLDAEFWETDTNKTIVKYGLADAFDGCCAHTPMYGWYLDTGVKIKHQVKHDGGMAAEALGQRDNNNYEVIGNIYENKELLDERK